MRKSAVISLISEVRGRATKFLEKELVEAGIEGLVSSHGAIISALFRHGGKLRMKEIAELINRDKSTVTYLVNCLHKAGFVERVKGEQDEREFYIVLTPKAWAVEDKINQISQKLVKTAYSGFTEQEQETLMALLERMKNNFEV
jgi:DNA-binding MarR family transcriptional regulator